MKKNLFRENLSNIGKSSNNDLSSLQVKTTDINVLLNRVRLEKKKVLNKKLLFSLSLIASVSLLAVFTNIQT